MSKLMTSDSGEMSESHAAEDPYSDPNSIIVENFFSSTKLLYISIVKGSFCMVKFLYVVKYFPVKIALYCSIPKIDFFGLFLYSIKSFIKLLYIKHYKIYKYTLKMKKFIKSKKILKRVQ